jgi:hypothetical protein
MTTATLPLSEHVAIAQEMLDEAEAEFAASKILKGSEMLWGAAAHALIAVALRLNHPFNSHGALRNVTTRLPHVPGQPPWRDEYNTAEELHINFYHGQLSDEDVVDYRPRLRRFVARLLAVTNEPV